MLYYTGDWEGRLFFTKIDGDLETQVYLFFGLTTFLSRPTPLLHYVYTDSYPALVVEQVFPSFLLKKNELKRSRDINHDGNTGRPYHRKGIPDPTFRYL